MKDCERLVDMKATVILEDAKVHSRMDLASETIAVLKPGIELEIGRVLKSGKDRWVEVVLSSGRKGYIIGTTKIYPVTPITILSRTATVFKEKDFSSEAKAELKKGDVVDLLNVLKIEKSYWYLVRVKPGLEGYLSRDVKVKPVDQNPRGSARKHIFLGLFWLLGAVIIVRLASTGAGYSQQILSAILLLAVGVIEVVYGVVRYLQAMGVKKLTARDPDRKKAASAKKRSKQK